MKVYKIRNQEGLFSTGEASPDWSKIGKVWRNKGGLSSHLSLVNSYESNVSIYDGCEIVEYETVESLIIPIEIIMEEKKLKKAERERKYSEYIEKLREQQEKELLKKLKYKYEN